MVTAPDMATLYRGNRVNGLYKVLNLAWLGVMEAQRAGPAVYTDVTYVRRVSDYCRNVSLTAAAVDAELRCMKNSS